MKLLVINGPNLNFLGIREKGIYGTQDYQYLLDMIQNKAKETGCEIETYQSNHEGAIIDRIQEAYFDGTEGIVIPMRFVMHLQVLQFQKLKYIFLILRKEKSSARHLLRRMLVIIRSMEKGWKGI